MVGIYRKIYQQHYGLIPKDEYGVTYDIHHIDGDRSNNNISNLISVSVLDHYLIHLKQGDMQAANAILLRIKSSEIVTPEERSRIASEAAKEVFAKGLHPWIGGEFQKKEMEKRRQDGTMYFLSDLHSIRTKERNLMLSEKNEHNFQSDESKDRVTARNEKTLEDGTHPFLNGVGAKICREKIENKTHHFQDKSRQKILSDRAKAKNSFIINRIDHDGKITQFIGIKEAVNAMPGTTWKKIAKACKTGIPYFDYKWINLGKGISSTTIPSGSTEQANGSGKAAHPNG